MAILIIMAIMFAVITGRDVYKYCESLTDYFTSTFLTVVMSLCGLVIGFFIAFAIGFFVPKQWVQTDAVQLAGLRNGQSNYYVRASLSNTSETFFYYKQAGPALIPGQVRAGNNVSIIEEKDRSGGMLKIFTERTANKLWDIVAIAMPNEKYEFYVPAGTVIREFNLR